MARRRRQLERALNIRVRSNAGATINDLAMLVAGVSIGAMAMYIFDADSGRRRRALARDKLVHYLKLLQWNSARKAEDLRNRAVGSLAEMRSRVRDAQAHIPDDVLHERVRAQLGHVVSHPGGLEIEVHDGYVTVGGPVLQGEGEKIRERLKKTRGVRDFSVRVSEHASKEGIPSLQGESRMERRESRA